MKIVITGPSGCGKTTLIQQLKESDYTTISESAKEVIQEGYNDLYELEKKIVLKQGEKEQGGFIADRGFGDIIGFSRYFGVELPFNVNWYYDKVFYLPMVHPKADFGERLEESEKEAEYVFYNYIVPAYKENGINPIKLPTQKTIKYIVRSLQTKEGNDDNQMQEMQTGVFL